MVGKCVGRKCEIDIWVIFFVVDGSKDRFFMFIGWDVLWGKGWDKFGEKCGKNSESLLMIIFEVDWVLLDFFIKLVEIYCVLFFIVVSIGNVVYIKLFLVIWLVE